MKLRALAKINLGLDVTGKREDGYHEVRMVMQTIQMYDQLEIKESKEPGIRLTTIKKANTEATIFLTSFLILITRIPPSSLIRTFNQIRKRLAHSNIEYSFHSLY